MEDSGEGAHELAGHGQLALGAGLDGGSRRGGAARVLPRRGAPRGPRAAFAGPRRAAGQRGGPGVRSALVRRKMGVDAGDLARLIVPRNAVAVHAGRAPFVRAVPRRHAIAVWLTRPAGGPRRRRDGQRCARGEIKVGGQPCSESHRPHLQALPPSRDQHRRPPACNAPHTSTPLRRQASLGSDRLHLVCFRRLDSAGHAPGQRIIPIKLVPRRRLFGSRPGPHRARRV